MFVTITHNKSHITSCLYVEGKKIYFISKAESSCQLSIEEAHSTVPSRTVIVSFWRVLKLYKKDMETQGIHLLTSRTKGGALNNCARKGTMTKKHTLIGVGVVLTMVGGENASNNIQTSQ